MYVEDFIDCEMEMSACTRSRLYPIAPNNSRIPKEDIVLSGYKVPAGVSTHVCMLVTSTFYVQYT